MWALGFGETARTLLYHTYAVNNCCLLTNMIAVLLGATAVVFLGVCCAPSHVGAYDFCTAATNVHKVCVVCAASWRFGAA